MLNFSHLPEAQNADIQVFEGSATTLGLTWQVWNKRRGTSMVSIYVWGPGGTGGSGAVGAASSAAGGGGGGSGGQSVGTFPAFLLPETLYVSVPASSGGTSRVAVYPDLTANHQLIVAQSGGSGSSGSGGTGGTAGAAGAIATMALMPLSGLGVLQLLAGQAGAAGGGAVTGLGITLPVTGLLVTGGTGGGGVGAAAGSAGGAFTVAGIFPPNAGGLGASAAGVPGGAGAGGFSPIRNLLYRYGGTGGGSSHGTATGAGLFGGIGGRGAVGCGGGGGGGALTASPVAIGGSAGPGQIIIMSW